MLDTFIRRYATPVVLTLLMAVALTGCLVGGTSATAAKLDMVAKDHSFTAPAQVGAGWVTVSLDNQGQSPHHAQLLHLNQGVSVEQFQATLRDNPPAVLGLATLAGGPGVVDPGGSQATTTFLEPGSYIVICVVPDEQGVPHAAHGMLAPLEVVPGGAYGQEPKADAEVSMVDFGFILPDTIPAGEQTWKIVAAGKQPHEMLLLKLAEGKTLQDAQAWMHQPAGAPPFSNAGGLQGIDPGEAGYLHLELSPGNYVVLCHVPDPASGKAHLELGMIAPFTVQ